MPQASSDFTSVDPAPYFVGARGFDFTTQLAPGETITGVPTVTISVKSGTDPSPSSHLIGGPSISGNIVSQVIGSLVGGVTYLLIATVSTLLNGVSGTRTISAHLPCRNIS